MLLLPISYFEVNAMNAMLLMKMGLHRGKTLSHPLIQGIGLYIEVATPCVSSLCNPSSIPRFVFSWLLIRLC